MAFVSYWFLHIQMAIGQSKTSFCIGFYISKWPSDNQTSCLSCGPICKLQIASPTTPQDGPNPSINQSTNRPINQSAQQSMIPGPAACASDYNLSDFERQTVRRRLSHCLLNESLGGGRVPALRAQYGRPLLAGRSRVRSEIVF